MKTEGRKFAKCPRPDEVQHCLMVHREVLENPALELRRFDLRECQFTKGKTALIKWGGRSEEIV